MALQWKPSGRQASIAPAGRGTRGTRGPHTPDEVRPGAPLLGGAPAHTAQSAGVGRGARANPGGGTPRERAAFGSSRTANL